MDVFLILFVVSPWVCSEMLLHEHTGRGLCVTLPWDHNPKADAESPYIVVPDASSSE